MLLLFSLLADLILRPAGRQQLALERGCRAASNINWWPTNCCFAAKLVLLHDRRCQSVVWLHETFSLMMAYNRDYDEPRLTTTRTIIYDRWLAGRPALEQNKSRRRRRRETNFAHSNNKATHTIVIQRATSSELHSPRFPKLYKN